MATLHSQTDQSMTLLKSLEQAPCSYCEDGHLVRKRYKGNEAVVCTACGTPGAQVWTE